MTLTVSDLLAYASQQARIEAADYDVFSQLVRVPRPAQARIAARTWWQLKWRKNT